VSRPPLPTGPAATEVADAWAGYLAAAQRLDAVRRAASTVVSEQAQAVEAVQHELDGVRARLAPQHSRLLHDHGVPPDVLTPRPAEVAAATQAMAGGPAAALAALRQARDTADAADAAMLGRPHGTRGLTTPWPPWMRNLLVYGPFAAAVLGVQLVLYLVAPAGSLPTYALLCGLSLPLLAFGLGWVTIGFVFGGDAGADSGGRRPGADPGGRPGAVDRTPVLGAVVCLAPIILTCMGVGLLALLR
jgi:hypothetical protein